MVGARLKLSTMTAIAALTASAAQGADYSQPLPPPPQPIVYQQPQQDFAEGWYLRGYVGVGMNSNFNLDVSPSIAPGFFAAQSISDTVFVGGGVGYTWNNWLRLEGSAEYRSKTRFTMLAAFQPVVPGPVAVDQYEGHLKSWVFLANAFVDLGTWNCFTPFVGAGVGAAYNMITDFTDVTPNVAAFGATGSAFGVGRNTSTWNFAWALYAGVTYNVSKSLNVDLTYRYLSYGSARDTIDCFGAAGCNEFKFKDLHSHDLMLGLRWTCCEVDQPRYFPPPPLHSKG